MFIILEKGNNNNNNKNKLNTKAFRLVYAKLTYLLMSDMTGPVFNVFQRGGELELGGELHHEAVTPGGGAGGRGEGGRKWGRTCGRQSHIPWGRISQPTACICKNLT